MATARDTDDDVLVRVENVVKYFPVKAGGFLKHTVGQVHAVDDVSLVIERGKTLGLVGETGSGKSTLARCVAGLIPVTSGKVFLNGTDISRLSRSAMRPLRREVQMIFQDPYSSLNPRRRVGAIIGDPFAIHKTATGAERKRMVQELMERVGLNPEHFNRFPAEFSGGQRQRIGVARALALRPKLIICDEPVSALDVSIQAQVLNLLADLQTEYGLSYLFIAHDLEVVRHVSDKVAVMYLGRIGEAAPADSLYNQPRHPYTVALLSAAPAADPDAAAAFARVGHGTLLVVMLASIPGLMKFDPLYWWAGRRWGERVIHLMFSRKGRSVRYMGWAQRWGRWVIWPAVVVAPFLPIPTALVYIIAGWSGMSLVTFLILDLIGSLMWAGLLAGLGYELGHRAVVVAQEISRYGLWISLGIVVLIIASQIRAQRARTRRSSAT